VHSFAAATADAGVTAIEVEANPLPPLEFREVGSKEIVLLFFFAFLFPDSLSYICLLSHPFQ
jgi:hypothetical protein